MSPLCNFLEPDTLIEHFLRHPPDGFSTFTISGVPAFSTRFDLLTTMEPAMRKRIEAVTPRFVRRRLIRPAAFAGTTVSEFALLPSEGIDQFLEGLLAAAKDFEFIIIKDIPADAMLVGEPALASARQLATVAQQQYGFVMLEGQALAYVPIDFTSIDEFLTTLSASRRKNIRRKLKSRAAIDIECVSTGDVRFRDETLLGTLYALYLNVYDQSETTFDRLTPAFFRAVLQDATAPGLVFMYSAGRKLIGYNLCFALHDVLIDKYVGFVYPDAREHNLYAVSWIHNLEYALANGLRFYIAGWTDPAVKRELGARFTLTQHAVLVRNPALRAALRPFKRFFEADRAWASE